MPRKSEESGLGVAVKGETGSKRIELRCEHHNGLVYVVPSEGTWVCDADSVHVHALAGFLSELVALNDRRVEEAMQRWGLYYRERPLEPVQPEQRSTD
mgnify:CR=1 FL=1